MISRMMSLDTRGPAVEAVHAESPTALGHDYLRLNQSISWTLTIYPLAVGHLPTPLITRSISFPLSLSFNPPTEVSLPIWEIWRMHGAVRPRRRKTLIMIKNNKWSKALKPRLL